VEPAVFEGEGVRLPVGRRRALQHPPHQAQLHQQEAGSEQEIKDAVADKGYHSADTLTNLREHTTYRSYVPEPERRYQCVWTDKPPEQREAVIANRRRTRGERGRKRQRLRSERVERSFAHVCETGRARRTWLTGIENVRKRYLISAAAHNLGLLMRSLFKMGTPRGLQQFQNDLEGIVSSVCFAWIATARRWKLPLSILNFQTGPNALPTNQTSLALVA
jgi:hypothetical protein